MNNLGLYIHIPFCERKCGYCDFYSVTERNVLEQYTHALIRQLKADSKKCSGYVVDTIYFGGGTPSLLSCESFSAVLACIFSCFSVSDSCEITIEVNPSSVSREKAICYRRCGVNRVSIGMQSALDSELRFLGRMHDLKTFEDSYRFFRDAGFDNISVDLMYALPGQTLEEVKTSVEYLLSIHPEHISAYCLKIEDNTPFGRRGIREAVDETAFAMYAQISEILSKSGYIHYEISNFSKSGRRSRHNLKYWKRQEYLGFGPAAYSYFRGKRFGFARDLDAYLSGTCEVVDQELIDEKEAFREEIMLGLRLKEGIPAKMLDRRKIEFFSSEGYLICRDGMVSFTTKGMFVSNAIISEFLD